MNIAPAHCSQVKLQNGSQQSRVLVADDDPFIRRLLTHLIERTRLCCAIMIAEDGQQAWQLYQQHGADLIITDNNMPIMDGMALTKAVRQEQPELPIIMVSGSPHVKQQAHNAGASIFLQKPLEFHRLLQNIVYFLSPDAAA